MNAKNFITLTRGFLIIFLLIFSMAFQALKVEGQESNYPGESEKFSQEELTQMLAPIALYPDVLLSQVLMASTYPIEVIEADRWVRKNPELKGESLDDALVEKVWDPSVKALCHIPSVLSLMSERISQTTTIGNAFLAQEDEVMAVIQELRAKAHAQGNLATTEEQKIIVEKETIIIEPANPRVIYVPYYDPFYIYGPWLYPAYPPYFWGPSRVGIGVGISYWPAFYFGFAYGSWSYFDWPRHYIYIDVHKRPRFVRRDRWRTVPGRWNHLPVHRKGVAYRDKFTARKYGQYPHRSRDFRPDTRGFPERRDRDREQRFGDQRRFDSGTAESIQRQPRQDIQERRRIEPAGREPQPTVQDRQDQGIKAPEREVTRQIERSRQKIKQEVQVQQTPDRPQRTRIKPDRQKQRQPVMAAPRTYQQRQPRERIERVEIERSRDNIFNRVEDGRRELESSTRGQSSRKGRQNDNRRRGK